MAITNTSINLVPLDDLPDTIRASNIVPMDDLPEDIAPSPAITGEAEVEGLVRTKVESNIPPAKGTSEPSYGEAFREGAINFPKSFATLIGDVFKSAGVAAEQMTKTVEPGYEPLGVKGQLSKNKKIIQSLWSDLQRSYGSEKAIKETIAKNPARILSDASAILMGGGALTAKAGLKTVGKAISATGRAIEPINIVTALPRAIGKGITHIPPLRGLPRNLYASALKPTVKAGPASDVLEETLKITERNLAKGRTVSFKVWEKVKNEIKRYKTDAKRMIDEGTKRGDTVDIHDIVDELDTLKNDTAFADWRPDLLEKAVDRTKKSLVDYHLKRSQGYLTPSEVQKIKFKQWKDVEKNFGQMSLVYKDAIQKSLGHGAKKSLEKLYPELKNINIPMGELLDFNTHLSKALKAHITADEVRNLAFIVKAILDNPAAKSKVAIWLRKAQKSSPLANPKALERNLAYQLGRIESQDDLTQERPAGSRSTLGVQ